MLHQMIVVGWLALGSLCFAGEGFAPLFDGRTFNGWEGNLDMFRIEDGAIVAGTLKEAIPRNEFLCTTKEYGDFELRLKAKLVGGMQNGGVQFRSQRIPNHHEMIGYQADVGAVKSGMVWGALYDESRRRKFLVPPDQDALKQIVKTDGWNEIVVRCKGTMIQVWLNGVQTVNYTETDESLPQTGLIAVQIHGGDPAEVWYKDIEIRELGEESAGLVAPGAEVEKLADGFAFTEGPACDAKGNVYFSDVKNSRTHIWSVDGKLSTFRENTGRGNGLYFDAQGNLIVCEGGNRQVTSVSPDGQVTVLAHRFDGKLFNSPNDLWIDGRGGFYFTDPRYGPQDGMEQDGFHVYYVAPDRKTITRVIDDLVKPNGIIGTSDGKFLYVADAGDNKTYRYRIQPDATLTDRMLFAPQGSDGMTLDERGNLYLTRSTVAVYSPGGEKLTDIVIPETPANVTFGGKARKTLFITARTSLYALRMNVRGQ